MQILVVVANIQMRALKTEVEKGFIKELLRRENFELKERIKSLELKLEELTKAIQNLSAVKSESGSLPPSETNTQKESFGQRREAQRSSKTNEAADKREASVVAEGASGWTEVKNKRDKHLDGKEKERFRPSLFEDDWNVSVVNETEILAVSKGVAIVSQGEGEKIFSTLCGSTLSKPQGQIAVLTPNKIPDAGDLSEEIHVRVKVNENGKINFFKKWLTNVGSSNVLTMTEKKGLQARATLPIRNETSKVVVILSKRYMAASDYRNGALNPSLPFEQWLKKHNLETLVLFQSRACVKVMNDEEWFERIYTVPTAQRNKFLSVSGQDGIFTKPFRTQDTPDDTGTQICSLGSGVLLEDALAKMRTIATRSQDLEIGRRGIGMRIKKDEYVESVKAVLPPALAELETQRQHSKIYEIRAIPAWVAFEQIQESMKGMWDWSVELVRIFNRGSTKTMLVRAAKEPPRDHCIVQQRWCPIQRCA